MVMIWILAILAVIGLVANATMNEIRNRWSNLFIYLVKKGSKLEKWMNPALSQGNHKHDNRFIEFILSTALIMFTDFWHCLKFIWLNCWFSAFVIVADGSWWWLLWFNLAWGVIFELFIRGVFNTLGTKMKYGKRSE